jgi:uncharacterized RDD family membrane protein YckC
MMSSNPPLPPRTTQALFCSNCGASVNPGDPFCSKCAAPQPGSHGAPAVAAPRAEYAGFWIRFAAWLLDAIIIGVVFTPIQVAIFSAMGVSMGMAGADQDPERMVAIMLPAIFLTSLLSFAAQWLYEALMTSSSKQATVGKMACGLRVTDLRGQRLTFARATGRYFAKIISGMTLLIGYIMAGFTERKQALHDFIAGTYVLKG